MLLPRPPLYCLWQSLMAALFVAWIPLLTPCDFAGCPSETNATASVASANIKSLIILLQMARTAISQIYNVTPTMVGGQFPRDLSTSLSTVEPVSVGTADSHRPRR